MIPRDKENVEFLARFDEAEAAFALAVIAAVPVDMTVRVRKPTIADVGPTDPGYGTAMRKFKDDVSSIPAIVILKFLYGLEKYLSHDFSLFDAQYRDRLDTDRMIRIRYGYPRLDQTTISYCIGFLSDTIVQMRLEDLERAGLVERAPSKPPFPKQAWITKKGEAVIESAIAAARASLGPVMVGDLNLECAKETVK